MTSKKSYTLKEIQQKMANYCVYQDRCHQEIEQKFRDFDLIPEAKDHILLFLIEHDFLNEERFAMNFAFGKFNQKKWGKNRIRRELKFKNIEESLIQKALDALDMDDYWNTLEQLFFKKMEHLNEKNLYKKKQKIYQYLAYKGYESDLIWKMIKIM